MRGGVKRNIFLRGSPTVEKRIGALIYIDFIDRQTLKFLCVPFEYLQKKRTKSYREGGVSTLNISKGIGTLNQKNPNVLPQGKLVFAGSQHPSRLSLLRQNQKGHFTYLSSPLVYQYQKYLSLSRRAFFNKPILIKNNPKATLTPIHKIQNIAGRRGNNKSVFILIFRRNIQGVNLVRLAFRNT